MSDFVGMSENREKFISYFGSKWAPPNVQNDPNHLNDNWVPNVIKLWGK